MQSFIGKARSSRPVQRETPAGYRRAKASDLNVFFRGDWGGLHDSDDDGGDEDNLKRRWGSKRSESEETGRPRAERISF